MSIHLIPEPEYGAIRVTWKAASPVTSIIRTDANGTQAVRTIQGTLPSAAGTLEDYEAALTGQVRYDLTGPGGSAATALDLDVEGIVSIPQEPARRVILPILREPSEERTAISADDQIIGRPDALPTVWEHSWRSVAYRAIFTSHAEATALAILLARGRVVQLRQPCHPGLDSYHLPRGSRITIGDERGLIWIVDWTGIEQRRPIGPILGTLGWDYDDLATAYPDYATVEAGFEDYTELEAGERP